MSVTYNGFDFPLASVLISDEPIYVEGKLDHTRERIQILGTITGASLNDLSSLKNDMQNALSLSFQELDIDIAQFDYSKPISISFSDSDLTTILPYSVEFEVFSEKDFSNFYGVSDPVDSWSYSEQDGRLISAVHTVSAKGIKINDQDALDNAKTFVESRLNDFENYSIINPDIQTAFIREKTEEIDRFQNTYSVTETYSLSSSRFDQPNNGLVTVTTQINYSKNSESSVTVSGNIIGSINGPSVNESMFTALQAMNQATISVEKSKSSQESNFYEIIKRGPTSSSFEKNEIDNSISFTYTFSDAFNEGEVIHDYTVSVSASKDSAIITVSIDGEIIYKGTDNPYDGEEIEDWPRYLEIDQKFQEINPYNLAVQEYKEFFSVFDDFDGNSYLDPEPLSESITKSPFVPSISYSYSYSNKPNSNLNNLTLEYTDEKPIIRIDLVETLGGFQENETSILGKKTVSASAQESAASLSQLRGIVNDYLTDGCFTFDESSSESDNSISYAKSRYYS
jgi:hypothetical protein